MSQKPNQDDSVQILRMLDPSLLFILRESMEHGMWKHRRSINLDPDGHSDYSSACKASMINDAITATLRRLVDDAASTGSNVSWVITENQRGTEVLAGEDFALRVKRVKRSRGDRSTNVLTGRQKRIRQCRHVDMPGQALVPFKGQRQEQAYSIEGRIWLTAAFDLDEVEEQIERAWVGVEVEQGFLWREPLELAHEDILARISPAVVDHLLELRHIRAG